VFSFKGVYSRLEWWRVYFVSVFTMMIILGTLSTLKYHNFNDLIKLLVSLTCLVLVIVIAYIQITASVKRFHDIGKSGRWWWLNIIPLGAIIVFIMNGFIKGKSDSLYRSKDTQSIMINPFVFAGIAFLCIAMLAMLSWSFEYGFEFSAGDFYATIPYILIASFYLVLFFGLEFDTALGVDCGMSNRAIILTILALVHLGFASEYIYMIMDRYEDPELNLGVLADPAEYIEIGASFIGSFLLLIGLYRK